jgi:hypothetical protein
VAALVALSMCSGCSFIFVQPPKDDDFHARGTRNCTTTPVAPVIDSLFTLTNLLSAFYVANEDNVTNKGTAVGVGLGVAAFWLSSAIYGYYNTSQCAELAREDDAGPYHRPVHFQHTGYVPPPPSRPVVSAPAEEAAPASATAAPPRVQQQQDDDDEPGTRQQTDRDDPATGMAPAHKGSSGRPDLTPRFGN